MHKRVACMSHNPVSDGLGCLTAVLVISTRQCPQTNISICTDAPPDINYGSTPGHEMQDPHLSLSPIFRHSPLFAYLGAHARMDGGIHGWAKESIYCFKERYDLKLMMDYTEVAVLWHQIEDFYSSQGQWDWVLQKTFQEKNHMSLYQMRFQVNITCSCDKLPFYFQTPYLFREVTITSFITNVITNSEFQWNKLVRG